MAQNKSARRTIILGHECRLFQCNVLDMVMEIHMLDTEILGDLLDPSAPIRGPELTMNSIAAAPECAA